MSAISLRRYGPAVPANRLHVVASDGCEINVRILRKPTSKSAVPLVFVHALAMDGDMWHGVAEELACSGRMSEAAMYAVDCRGHGDSGTSESAFKTQRFAEDLSNVLDAIGSAQAHVIGCSMGGTVALALAGNFPDRVASLTVVDCTAWYGPEAASNWETRAQTALSGGMQALVDFQLARWFSPAFLQQEPGLVRESLAVFNANRVAAYANSCRMLGHADERQKLRNFLGPVAVVVGEEDYATPPAMAEDIASRMANAKLTVIAGTRHYTPLEAPGAVAACIEDAISRATTG